MIRSSIVAMIFLFAGSAAAHHAFSAFYDTDNVGEITGEVIETLWINPHAGFRIRTDDGEVWNIETAPVNRLQRLGLDGSVSVGDRVGFVGAFSRLGRNEVLATNMIMPSGEEVLLDPGFDGRLGLRGRATGAGGSGAAAEASSDEPEGIYRVWTRARSPEDRDPERTLTEAAQAAVEAWDPVTDDPALRCIAPGMPVAMDTPFPLALEERDGQILMRIEQWDGLRTIHMESGVAEEDLEDSLMGYSAGRWEGQTLVVETTDISWPYVDEFGTPKSDEYMLVERFTFNEDSTAMTWEATATDPATYVGPAFLGSVSYAWVPGEEIKPYNCTIAGETP
ncbi:MAG: DUF6152 family protein [Rhodospirillaceae bacterium]|nr:DUF6152 family protein [Rhodospirillaceae bacterium]